MRTLFLLLLGTLSSAILLTAQSTELFLSDLQIPFVLVNDPGNKADTSAGGRGLGSLSKNFLIGKYEITASQYCSFLTAVASHEDPHHLYKKEMGTDPQVACITQRELADGTYQYDLIDQRGMLPITYVTLRDAQRFCNWLENNCPSYQEGATTSLAASTEKGAYQITLQEGKEVALFNPQAHYYIPTESEWVKAAYYKGGGTDRGYWNYPTQSDVAPNNGAGNVANQANYETMATLWKPSQKNSVLIPVDYFSKTESFYGACDLGGNVAEWTCSLCEEEDPLSNIPSAQAVRGGSWKSCYSIWWDNELMRAATPSYYDSLTATNFIGFRIAATLAPSNEAAGMPMDKSSTTKIIPSAQKPITQVIWTFIRSLVGCGMCLLGIFFTTLRTIGGSLGISTELLETIENFFIDLQIAESSYLPGWVVYRLVPVLVELGLLGLFLIASYEVVYYWPTLQEACVQLWYAL